MLNTQANITEKAQIATSPSVVDNVSSEKELESLVDEWPAVPIETEIYIMPDGHVIVADLPVELADMVETWNTDQASS